jgi:hypothetical protein
LGLIKFFDNFDLTPLDISKEVRDQFLPINPNVEGQPLIVRLKATHAGIITKNNGYYLPDKMRAGVPSWTQNYPKPILIHHNDDADPIGRVIKADYVDISNVVRDRYKDKTIKDSVGKTTKEVLLTEVIDKLVGGKYSHAKAVDVVTNLTDAVLDDPNYEGLGYIQLIVSISDSDAKQKILDGRYLTGSTASTTNKAVCSVCKEDWADSGGPCEHRPGKSYDGVKAFLIAGELTYNEYSFVNRPADRHSQIIEITHGNMMDSIEVEYDSNIEDTSNKQLYTMEIIMADSEDAIALESLDDTLINKSKDNMEAPINVPDANKETTESDKYSDLVKAYLKDRDEDTINGVLAIVNTLSAKEKKLLDTEDKIELDIYLSFYLDKWELNKFVALESSDEDKAKALSALRPTLSEDVVKTALVTLKDKGDEAFNTFLLEEEAKVYDEDKDEGILALEKLNPQDAKLNTQARKKLSSSTFCGPNRSFPVPDCSHAGNAKARLGHSKMSPAQRRSVLSCVLRKQKALGCGSKDAVKDSIKGTLILKSFDELFQSLKDSYPDELAKLLAADEEKISALEVKVAALEAKLNDKACSECADNLQKLEDLTDELESVRAELALVHKDLEATNEALIASQEALNLSKAERIADHMVLKGVKIGDKSIDKELRDTLVPNILQSADLDGQLTGLIKDVDIIKLADNINSGLTNIPVGTVDDPVVRVARKQEMISMSNKPTVNKDTLTNITETYLTLLLGGSNPKYGQGKVAAENYRQDMVDKGFLPKEDSIVKKDS